MSRKIKDTKCVAVIIFGKQDCWGDIDQKIHINKPLSACFWFVLIIKDIIYVILIKKTL